MYEINEKLFSQGSCTPGDLYRTRTRTPTLFQLIFQLILPPFRTACLPAQLCIQNTNVRCPPRSRLVRRVSPPSV